MMLSKYGAKIRLFFDMKCFLALFFILGVLLHNFFYIFALHFLERN